MQVRGGLSQGARRQCVTTPPPCPQMVLRCGMWQPKRAALVELVAHILTEPYFDQLRTKETVRWGAARGHPTPLPSHGLHSPTLRFPAGLHCVERRQQRGQRAGPAVHHPERQGGPRVPGQPHRGSWPQGRASLPQPVTACPPCLYPQLFLEEYGKQLAEMGPEQFELNRKAVLVALLQAPKSLAEESNLHWPEIEGMTYLFDRPRATAEALRSLTIEVRGSLPAPSPLRGVSVGHANHTALLLPSLHRTRVSSSTPTCTRPAPSAASTVPTCLRPSGRSPPSPRRSRSRTRRLGRCAPPWEASTSPRPLWATSSPATSTGATWWTRPPRCTPCCRCTRPCTRGSPPTRCRACEAVPVASV